MSAMYIDPKRNCLNGLDLQGWLEPASLDQTRENTQLTPLEIFERKPWVLLENSKAQPPQYLRCHQCT
jgi:hypothetical protein